jgi:hypothetical protein
LKVNNAPKDSETKCDVTDYDLFRLAPNVYVKGKKTVGTICGLIVTLFCTACVLMFAVPRLINIAVLNDKIASSQTIYSKFDSSEIYVQKNFYFAFGVQGLYDGKSRSDPKFNRW